jgi:hypothetical protein
MLMVHVQDWPEPFEVRVERLIECIGDLVSSAADPVRRLELLERATAALIKVAGEIARGEYKRDADPIPPRPRH